MVKEIIVSKRSKRKLRPLPTGAPESEDQKIR
jgi:hypothetical protein